jgi:beta-galactosidase
LQADRREIQADGEDLSFVTLTVEDKKGLMVSRADNKIHFEISGPGEIVATDNGDPTDLVSFSSSDRQAFNGLCLAIVRAKAGQTGTIKLTASADNSETAAVFIEAR